MSSHISLSLSKNLLVCKPITTAQGLEHANSLIERKSTEKKLIEWISKNCHAYWLKGNVKLEKS
jgi:hypothetical protein